MRLLTSLLCAVFAAVLIAGCGSADKPKEKTKEPAKNTEPEKK